MTKTFISAIIAAILVLSGAASAAVITTFSDKSTFISSTGATNVTGPLPSLGKDASPSRPYVRNGLGPDVSKRSN